MNGTTSAAACFLPSVATSWSIVGSGDFNGDGQMDILWQNSSGARAIWLMTGTTYSSSVYFGTAATSWNIRNY